MTKLDQDAVGQDIERIAALVEGLFINVLDGRVSLSADQCIVLREAGQRCRAAATADRHEEVNAGVRRLRDLLSEVHVMASNGRDLDSDQVAEMQRVAQHAVAIAGLPEDTDDNLDDVEDEMESEDSDEEVVH